MPVSQMQDRELLVFGGIFLAYLAFLFVVLVFSAIVSWRIVGKTGYPGALGLLLLLPIANLVMILILAFSEWPIQRELKALKQAMASRTGNGGMA